MEEKQRKIKLLRITIDDIDILCNHAARQINLLYRFNDLLDIKESEVIHNTFILANFNYCPLVWHILRCIVSYRISCDSIDTFLGFRHPPWVGSPSAMCYMTNQWITYNLPIDLIDAQAFSEAMIGPLLGLNPICYLLFDEWVNCL